MRNDGGQLTFVRHRHGTAIDGSGVRANPIPDDPSPLVEYEYQYAGDNGKDGKLTYEKRTGSGLSTDERSYDYDELGRLKLVNLIGSSCKQYLFDRDSNRTEIQTASSNVGPPASCGTFTSAETYIYDRTNANSPGLDELTSRTPAGQAAVNFVYDGDGRATSRGSDTLTWDGRDRSTGGTFNGTTVTYSYDALGRQRQRVGGATTTRYLFAGGDDAPLYETDSGGTITESDVDGPAGDLAHYTGPPATGSAVSFLYYNGHGDLAAEADNTGARTAAYAYDPYGAVTPTPGVNSRVERYNGRWDKKLDTSSNLIQMGARPYDPTLGRFDAPDPVEGGALNLYDYAAQDPLSNYDLDGECVFGLRCPKALKRAGHVAGTVVRNPWFQTAVTVAACSTGVLCATAVVGFTALNAYDRYKREGGFTQRWFIGTGVDVALAAIPLRNARALSAPAWTRSGRFPLLAANQGLVTREVRRQVVKRNVAYGGLAIARSYLPIP